MPVPELSIVVPAFNEGPNLPRLFSRLTAALAETGSAYEIIVVDDGSVDDTFEIARAHAANNENVVVLRLSRNFGHQSALLAGLRAARGSAVITIDADLQHPPELIPRLVELWRTGKQVVHTVRSDSRSSGGVAKRMTSFLFYKIFRWQSELPIEPGMADFRLVDRSALDPVLRSPETRLFLRGMFVWVGFRQGFVTYTPAPRAGGQPQYGAKRMLRFAANALLAHSERPLYWSFFLGALVSLLSVLYGGYVVAIRVFSDAAVPGWASVAALVSFLMGVQFIMIGLLGAYVAAIYAEVKRRPPFIVAERYPPAAYGSSPAPLPESTIGAE